MERVSLDDVDDRMGPATEKRLVGDALGAVGVALNHYVLAPGDSFAFGYHAHEDQEEIFYVVSGTATFETEESEVAVGPDEAIRFAPGEHQRGWNRGDEDVVALAIGAPAEMGATEILRECGDCGERTPQRIAMTDERDALVTICERCDAETGRFT
jgi:uncharacterized cupin superfamily protein